MLQPPVAGLKDAYQILLLVLMDASIPMRQGTEVKGSSNETRHDASGIGDKSLSIRMTIAIAVVASGYISRAIRGRWTIFGWQYHTAPNDRCGGSLLCAMKVVVENAVVET